MGNTEGQALIACWLAFPSVLGYIMATGDILAQQGVEKKGWKNHDVIRTTRLAFYGGCIFAPILMPWFRTLERIDLKSRVLTTVARVSADQFIAAPCLVTFFFTAMPVLEGKPDEISKRLKEKWQPILVKNWMVFIPTQAINMSIVPPPLRLLVVNVVSLFWTVATSPILFSFVITQTRTSLGQIVKLLHLLHLSKRHKRNANPSTVRARLNASRNF